MGRYAGKTPLERKVIVPTDDSPVDEFEDARETFNRAQLLGNDEEKVAAKARLEAATTALEAASIVLWLRALGRDRYQELVDEHPPTAEQQVEHRTKHGFDAPYNAETFAPALTYESLAAGEAAHAIEPATTAEEFLADVWHSPDWNAGEVADLFNSALEVNTQRRVAELGN